MTQQRRASRPSLTVRSTFLSAPAWPPAVFARLSQVLNDSLIGRTRTDPWPTVETAMTVQRHNRSPTLDPSVQQLVMFRRAHFRDWAGAPSANFLRRMAKEPSTRASSQAHPQRFLNFFSLPHGKASLRPATSAACFTVSTCRPRLFQVSRWL